MKNNLLTVIIFFATASGFAQNKMLTLEQAIDDAVKNNLALRAATYSVESQRQLERTSFDLPKADVTIMYGQYNSFAKNDNNITITQAIPFTVFGSQGSLNKKMTRSKEMQKSMTENEIIYQVKRTYYELLYVQSLHRQLQMEDSLYQGFLRAASARYRTGESRLLEKSTAEEQRNEVIIRIGQNEVEIIKLQSQLKNLIHADELPTIAQHELNSITLNSIDTSAYKGNPSLSFSEFQIKLADGEKKLQQARFAPDLLVGVFSQTLIGTVNPDNGNVAGSSNRFTGFQIGLSLPLWFAPHRARVRSAELSRLASESNYLQFRESLRTELDVVANQLDIHRKNLDYYETSALPNAERILTQSQTAFREGEIDYPEFLLGIRNSIGIRENYLKSLNEYNQSVIYLDYLTGKK